MLLVGNVLWQGTSAIRLGLTLRASLDSLKNWSPLSTASYLSNLVESIASNLPDEESVLGLLQAFAIAVGQVLFEPGFLVGLEW